MALDMKGLLSPFTLLTSFLTGMGFPLIGALIFLDLEQDHPLYFIGLVLTMIGGFIAHWLLAHSIHDYFKRDTQNRKTISKNGLRLIYILSIFILFTIATYLSIYRGWPVLIFSIIGLICCTYAEGILHHESQMAFGAMFLVIGGFYVQAGTLLLDSLIWIKVILMALFAFFSQYGWLLFYRIDDYKWDDKIKNRSILITKSALLFLILYLLL
jgi:hypothetical protein